MKLFKDSRGFIIAFGFDMRNRAEAPHMIAWNNPPDGTWAISETNLAGNTTLSGDVVAPEFIRECEGAIVAYQPGLCIEMTYIGPQMVWSIRLLRP